MKKLVIVSLLATMSVSTMASQDALINDNGMSAATTTMALGGALLAYGGAAGGALIITTIGAPLIASTNNRNMCKEVALHAKADIQEYNVSGELSPVLKTFVNEFKEANPETSTEDAIDQLSTEADAQLNLK